MFALIDMQLYSAGEIVKKLRGVTTRQILDLAEKGLIMPARETTGAGSPRLYDFQNIFEICICLALRGKLPSGGKTLQDIAEILEYIREADAAYGAAPRGEGRSLDIVYLAYDAQDLFTLIPITFDRLQVPLKELLKMSKKYRPQNYCTYLLEVTALREYLKGIF